jgi:hypothetical protein
MGGGGGREYKTVQRELILYKILPFYCYKQYFYGGSESKSGAGIGIVMQSGFGSYKAKSFVPAVPVPQHRSPLYYLFFYHSVTFKLMNHSVVHTFTKRSSNLAPQLEGEI